MDRREFVKGGAGALVGSALSNDRALANSSNEFRIDNSQLAWRFEKSDRGIKSVRLDNKISGRKFALRVDDEFRLTYASGTRVEIPWWSFTLTDDGKVAPDAESGLRADFHRKQEASDRWKPVKNLAGGQKGRHYDGYGWFRTEFKLPESARGQAITFLLGGYDQQDWNQHWVYLNGEEIGQRRVNTRWRRPGRHTLEPGDARYAGLKFGEASPNLLAVRAKGYDFHFQDLPPNILDRIVFHPWLFDQFISIGEPYETVTHFELTAVEQEDASKIRFHLHNAAKGVDVVANYELDGGVRRKWLEIKNASSAASLLLDIDVDSYQIKGRSTEGGYGTPVFVEDELFLGLDHPAGINQSSSGRVNLWHCPGRAIAAGDTLTSHASLVGVAATGGALDAFHAHIVSRSPRAKKKRISLYTCYGINNQWGGCSALSDDEVLDSQRVIKGWQSKGVKFDYFTIDQGWPSTDGDLTEFANQCFPDGPRKIIDGVDDLGMKFGLWFSVSEGAWSDGSNPTIQASTIPEAGDPLAAPTEPAAGTYRNGYPVGFSQGRQLCIASDPYFKVIKNAIQRQVADNKLRLVKFDMGNYYCNSTAHQHLPGKYSSEAMFDRLISVAAAARAASPDVFIVWYWGVGDSPFWGLYGDTIFESGLFLEGSGTSWVPSLFYRDSVTLALDQSTRYARWIPPLLKDSLGVWLSQIRWANFMGKHRWQEALIMDLGRGNLMFPQIWGDPNLLDDNDVNFLSNMMTLARENEALFLNPRRDFGDIFRNEPYAYSFCDGTRGLVFCNNVHFTSRALTLPLDRNFGMALPKGTPLQLTSHFPERRRLSPTSGTFSVGSTAQIWLRPFETLLLEVALPDDNESAVREVSAANAISFGQPLDLLPAPDAEWMDLKFADAVKLGHAGMRPDRQLFKTRLPTFDDRCILAIHVRLEKFQAEFRHSPYVAELVQVRSRVGNRNLQMSPVPDARQYGNTQNAGCSWVVYQAPVAPSHSGESFEFSVNTFLPKDVDAVVQGWLVKHWWSGEARPEADGDYGDAPS